MRDTLGTTKGETMNESILLSEEKEGGGRVPP
jgi:hypothetical protein